MSASSARKGTKLLHLCPYETAGLYIFYETDRAVRRNVVNWYFHMVRDGEIYYAELSHWMRQRTVRINGADLQKISC